VIGSWAIDWLSVLVLGALTLLDGARRIPQGAHILRRIGGGSWAVATPEEDRRRLIVSWWTPFTLRIVVEAEQSRGNDDRERLTERWRRMRRWIAALRLLGGTVLIGVVLGIPAATEMAGWRGLLFVLLIVGVMVIAVATTALLALRRLGLGRGAALRAAGGLLSPFAAPRAAEVVLERALSGSAPLAAIRHLVPAPDFAAWIRPRAYDLLRGHAHAGDPELGAALSRSELQRIVGDPPSDRLPREPWCARCGRVYRESTSCCSECDALSLTA
jgi:hypothetical protein